VQTPRTLNIIVDRPEVPVGAEVTVGMSVREILVDSGLGFGTELEDDCRDGGQYLVRLETGGELPPGTARLPGEAFLRLVEQLMQPGDERLTALLRVTSEVGVPLRMRLEVWRDAAMILAGFKRFAIARREDLMTNPAVPRFAVDERWLTARGGGDPRICAPEDGGELPVVLAGSEVTLAPDPDEDPGSRAIPWWTSTGASSSTRRARPTRGSRPTVASPTRSPAAPSGTWCGPLPRSLAATPSG
jgi:hypothetical protein